jgi:hypothetical protein
LRIVFHVGENSTHISVTKAVSVQRSALSQKNECLAHR